MNWKFFIGSCILAVGLLLKMGAPVIPVAVGIVAAGYLNWRKHRSSLSGSKKP